MRVRTDRYTATAVLVVSLAASVVVGSGRVSGQEPSAPAQLAAEGWLSVVDNGDYADSWAGAAAYFRNQVSESVWQTSMHGVRAPLGSVRSRRLATATAATSLPGAPDGDYHVFQFDTRFEFKQTAVETVTAMREADGHWRIAGYYIR